MPLAQGFLLEAGELQLLTAVLAGALKSGHTGKTGVKEKHISLVRKA